MKKTCFALFFFIFVSTNVFAQSEIGRYQLAVKGGTVHEYAIVYRIDTTTGKVWKLTTHFPYSDEEFLEKYTKKELETAKEGAKIFDGAIFKEAHWIEISEKPKTYFIGKWPKPLQ